MTVISYGSTTGKCASSYQWSWAPLRLPSPSHKLLSSSFLLLLALLTATNHDGDATWQLLVAAQNDSPFKGQGIAPNMEVVNGRVVPKKGNESQVPVYMSVFFDKLEDVDEVNYRFSAIFRVVLSWQDHRVPENYNAFWYNTDGNQREMHQNLLDCFRAARRSVNSGQNGSSHPADDGFTPSCSAAVAKGSTTSCNTPCFGKDNSYCCDSFWLPRMEISNDVFFSQDNYIDEYIFFDQQDSISESMSDYVVKFTRVHGVFSSHFDYHSFPFDHQVLNVHFSSKEHPVMLRSSMVTRGTALKSAARGVSLNNIAEVTGWTTNDVKLSCDGDPQEGFMLTENDEVVWQQFADRDPVHSAAGQAVLNNSLSSCVMSIHISRVANYYAWTSIFPVYLIALVCFSVFFASPDGLSLRLSTTVTLFLALVAVQYIVMGEVPKTAYLTNYSRLLTVTYFMYFFIAVESLLAYYITTLKIFRERKGMSSANLQPPSLSTGAASPAGASSKRIPAYAYASSCLPVAKEPDPEAALLMQADAEPGSQAREAGTAEPPAGNASGGKQPPAFESLEKEGGVSAMSGESEEDAERGGGGERDLSTSGREVGGGSARKGSRIGLIHFKEVHKRITSSEEEALRYARIVDVVCGIFLLSAYVAASCWIFLVK